MNIAKPLQYSEKINKDRITFYGNSIDEIVEAVIRIRKRNGVKSLEYNSVYNSIKPKISGSVQIDGPDSNNYKEKIRGFKKHNSATTRSVSLNDAANAASALMKIVKGEFVPEEEYRRRLLICAECPLRQQNSDCMGCGGSGRAARISMKFQEKLGHGYKLDKKVGREFCGFCGCSLSLLLVTKTINYKTESKDLNIQRPVPCWLRKDSENYVG